MDMAGVSAALSNVSQMGQIGTAVLSKAMEANEEMGDGMVELIDSARELSVNPNVGSNIDIRI